MSFGTVSSRMAQTLINLQNMAQNICSRDQFTKSTIIVKNLAQYTMVECRASFKHFLCFKNFFFYYHGKVTLCDIASVIIPLGF